jgi:hypothetical protein
MIEYAITITRSNGGLCHSPGCGGDALWCIVGQRDGDPVTDIGLCCRLCLPVALEGAGYACNLLVDEFKATA